MRRSLAAVVCGLLLVAAAPAAGAKKLTIRWYGQSYFQITTTAGTRVVIDPHAIDAFFSERNKVSADLVLCSHTHNDHTQVEVLENWDPKKVKRINGVKDEKGDGKRTDWNHVDEKFKDVRVRTVALYHDDMRGMVRGKNAAFVLEADGLRIVHLGDLGHKLTPAQVKHLLKDGPIDVLMVPVGGVYTINGSEAKAVVEQLKPKRYILPMHYG
ncbi:MAG TPA: MBL fold metallo-hydrolase, partial [Gemmataceae bacterium]|nr:MBL fold metallo-hydrolase [Gemmataceae bacterium]